MKGRKPNAPRLRALASPVGSKAARGALRAARAADVAPLDPKVRRGLPPAVRGVWRRLLATSLPWLAESDRPLVEAYCEAVAVRELTARSLHTDGVLVEASRRDLTPHRRNPAFSAWRDAVTLEARLAGDLGIGPVARLRAAGAALKDGGRAADPAEGIEGWLRSGGGA
jgi:P27 family predicted phage terminase small subunit